MSQTFINDPTFVKMEHEAFAATQRIFPCEPELMEAIPTDNIISAFQKDLTQSDHPFLIRVAGQSGSGKSSQLTPALEETLQTKKYVKINVGAFAVFHPQYNVWHKDNPATVREKTNGFALRALVLFCRHCILNKINVLLDMTLLEPEIELYLMKLATQMGYRIQIHVLCVPKKISDTFIRLRQKETGRFVRSTSSHYFFQALAPALKTLVRSDLFTRQDMLVLWTHNISYPVKTTHLNNHSVLNVLQYYQGKHFGIKKPSPLLKAKKRWMKLLVEMLNV